MDKESERRIDAIEGSLFAHGMALKLLIKSVVPDTEERRGLREDLCNAAEAMLLRRSSGHDDHQLQVVLAELEALFDRPSPAK